MSAPHRICSAAEAVLQRSALCGPLAVEVAAEDARLLEKVAETLDLFDVEWDAPHRNVVIQAVRSAASAPPAAGTSLLCDRMAVDFTETGPYATCRSGASCRRIGPDAWSIEVPSSSGAVPDDVEDLMLLVLTASWRAAGWVPIHAGAVAREGRCAILCAPSSGGKTTMTAALVRRRWKALGDDKLLLRLGPGGRPELAALQRTFNLHPRSRDWFPEVGDLERLPRYSVWTEKRKVRVEEIWPGASLARCEPSHLVHIRRGEGHRALRVAAMGQAEVLDTLLRQTVVPSDRETARAILAAIVPTARRLVGLRVDVGEDAFRDAGCLAALEEALR